MAFQAVKKQVERTGEASLGWYIGEGYVSRKMTVRSEVWCVVEENKPKPIAQCGREFDARRIAAAMNATANAGAQATARE